MNTRTNAAEKLLTELVAMPTITDDAAANERGLDYLEAYFTARGLHVRRFNFKGHGSLVATLKPNVKHAKILLYAHLDVVPASEKLFTLRHDGDQLFGRGVFDMKFAIAGYMQAVEWLKDTLGEYDFAIMVTTDEEYGGRDGINSIPDLLKEGYHAEACVMPDGARDWNVEAVAKGWWRFDLIAAGTTAHSSRPWEGDSASFKLVHALHELRMHFEDHGPATDTLNIGQIHGDGTYNQVPSSMRAQVEIRLATDDSQAKSQQLVEKLCKTHGLTTETRALVPPLKQDIGHPLLQAFMASITRITGHESKPCLSLAGSDASYFNAAGIPCAITYLPGGGHHSESEWVSHTALLQFPEVICDYLERNAKA